MALVLDATTAGVNSNTYVTLAEAKDEIAIEYLDMSNFTGAATATQNAALVNATRDIDSKLRLSGDKYDSEQALHFPTDEDYNSDGEIEIPDAVKRATVLQANYLIRTYESSQNRRDLIDSGVTEYTIGNMSEKISGSKFNGICSEARALLAPWIIRTVKIERG